MIKGDPYLIPGTGDTTKLLRNKLGITEQSELSEQENLLAGTRINELRKDLSILGNDKPDQKLLEKIHEYIFQDVYHTQGEHPYPIAGAVRVIGIRKLGDPQYPEPHSKYADNDLDNRIDYAFNQLEKDGYLKGLDQDVFIEKLAKHVAEVWENHCFREGNTRSTAMFTEHLARQAGYELKPIGRDFREALKTAALSENYKPLQKLLTDGLKKKHTPTVVKNAKEAQSIISRATDAHLTELMKPLVTERKNIQQKIERLKDELRRSKRPDAETITLDRLNAAKGDLQKFDKSFVSKGREMRAEATRLAKKQNPLAADVLAKYKASKKATQEVKKTKSQTKDRYRSR